MRASEPIPRQQRPHRRQWLSNGRIAQNLRTCARQLVAVDCTPYIKNEVEHNILDVGLAAVAKWKQLSTLLEFLDDIYTIQFPSVFPVPKDRPVLFGAYAWTDALLTLDTGDFQSLLGGSFYGLDILAPGTFLERERASGRLR